MKFKSFIKYPGILILLILSIFGLARDGAVAVAQQGIEKIEPLLMEQLNTHESADYIVHFKHQADLSAAYTMDWDARGEFVYRTLKDAASLSQAKAKKTLDLRAAKYQTFIAGNELYIWGGNLDLANELASLTDVADIRSTRTYHLDPVVMSKPFDNTTWAGDFLANHLITTVDTPAAAIPTWGITDTEADRFWATFSKQGDGIVVANIDTGVQWNHPALVQAYKCSANPSDPSCWFDPSNICGGSPCDNNGHGTHTMGTMVADDDPSLPYTAGMAPNAQWITCKGCESTDCSDYALNACADWILAPNGDPANRPDIVNNSWGGGGGDPWYLAKIQAWRAAGIFPAFSAGNDGPNCSTLGSPGDYQESFSSAAHAEGGNIASFSSRGPSTYGDDPYTKPNLSTPGVYIISTIPVNSWGSISGTSMASPHTAGAVALLWSCNPGLVGQVDATFQLLQGNSDPAPAGTCGAPADGQGNYTFGYGYLDVYRAGLMTCSNVYTGTLTGHVADAYNHPLVDVLITATNTSDGRQDTTSTDSQGSYTLILETGVYSVTAVKDFYISETVSNVAILTNTVTSLDISLAYLAGWTQLPLPASCPDWYAYDGEYYPGTGKVYYLGGKSGTALDGRIFAYDPAGNACASTGRSMTVPVSYYTIVTVNNGSQEVLCTFGGLDGGGTPLGAVQCYDPLTNAVSVVGTLPGTLGDYLPGGVAAVNNKVYVFGGLRTASSPYHSVQTWEWDPLGNSWHRRGDMTSGRGFIDAAVAGGRVYAFGGETTVDGINLTAQTIAEVFDPLIGVWHDAYVADLPTATAQGSAFGFDLDSPSELAGKILIVGGGQYPGASAEAFIYDIRTNTYEYGFPDLNVLRRNQAGFTLPGEPSTLWVIGGSSGSDAPPFAPPELYAVKPKPQPAIGITAPPLKTFLLPDETRTISFTIENLGTVALDWVIAEALNGTGLNGSDLVLPAGESGKTVGIPLEEHNRVDTSSATFPQADPPTEILWDQPLSTINHSVYIDQEFTDLPPQSRFLADDFANTAAWSVTKIFIPGSMGAGGTNLFYATSLTWQLYFDVDGIPDGDPAGEGVPPVWSLTLPPTDPQVTITPGTGGLPSNTTLTLSSPLILPPATYWLVFYPTLNSELNGEYGRQPSDSVYGYTGKFINPGGGFGFGTTWIDWTVLGAKQKDIAFRLEGSVMNDVPWSNVDIYVGTLDSGKTQTVGLAFDSTGLAPDIYRASLIIRSNDPDQPKIELPVILTVFSGETYLPIAARFR